MLVRRRAQIVTKEIVLIWNYVILVKVNSASSELHSEPEFRACSFLCYYLSRILCCPLSICDENNFTNKPPLHKIKYELFTLRTHKYLEYLRL